MDCFKICFDSVLGRHLISTRPLETGAVILKETPLVRGPFLNTVPVCLGCNKILSEESSQPCTKCGWPMCSPACEKNPLHVPECQFTEAKGTKIEIRHFGIAHPSYQFVSLLRCLYLKENHPEAWEKLIKLQSCHNESQTPTVPPEFVLTFFKLQDRFTRDEVERVSGILRVNGHEIPLTQPPQIGVYEKTSFLEHNCRANCTKTFTNDGEILVIAAESIGDDAHLSICYSDPLWGVRNRRFHLKETKDFWCFCKRCQDPSEFNTHLNSIKCRNKTCDGLLVRESFLDDSDDDWCCPKCDASLSDESASVILAKIGESLVQMPKGNLKSCKEFLKKYESVLAPFHYYMVDVKIALFQIFASMDVRNFAEFDLGVFAKLCEDLKDLVERVAPAETRLRGVLAFQNARVLAEMGRRKGGEDRDKEILAKVQDLLEQSLKLLEHEPSVLQEGKIYRQIKIELQQIKDHNSS